jgi:hypothetical protein
LLNHVREQERQLTLVDPLRETRTMRKRTERRRDLFRRS